MELLVSHHWYLSSSPQVSSIQEALSQHFSGQDEAKGRIDSDVGSISIQESSHFDLPSLDWSSIVGKEVESEFAAKIQVMCVETCMEIPVVSFLESGIFDVLQQAWYVAYGRIFVSPSISDEDLRSALYQWQHDKALRDSVN